MNILIIRMHRFGDILQLTPILQGLRKKFPGCRIFFFTASEMTDLLTENPDVDEVISIPEKKYRYYLKNKPEYYASIYNELYELISGLKDHRFQMIINRHYEFGGILAHLIGAEHILGQTFLPARGSFLNDPISAQLYDAILTNRKANKRNLVDWSCHIAGLQPGCGKMYFSVPETAFWQAERLLSEFATNDDPLIAVQMGAAKSFRRWGADNYFHIITWLIEVKGKKVVLLGTGDEKNEAKEICLRLGKAHENLIDLTGKTDFKTLGGVLKKCEKLITGDTGTMHMAAAVGTQVIAIFYGSAFPWETGPYGSGHLVLYADEKCAPCFNPAECMSGHSCRKAITPEHVRRAFEISEALTENGITDIHQSPDNVKLYLTHAKQGADQMLVNINEISNIKRDFSDYSGMEYFKEKGIPGGMDNLLNKGIHLLQKLHRGDIEGFMDLFPGYIDRWTELISYIKEKKSDENTSQALSQCLYPAINEAMRAIRAKDYSVLSDLIHYDFYTATNLLGVLLKSTPSESMQEHKRKTTLWAHQSNTQGIRYPSA